MGVGFEYRASKTKATILPAFYQTNWFRFLSVAAFLAIFWGLHRLRVHQLRKEETKFREAIETISAMAWMAYPVQSAVALYRS
jgi:hypothetical protein